MGRVTMGVACAFAVHLAGATEAGAASPGDLPPGFVYLRAVAPTVRQDIRYAGAHNFMGRPAAGYQDAQCILSRKAAEALSRIQAGLLREGLTLKVYDCYRPARAVADFLRWSQDSSEGAKQEFYPATDKKKLFALGYLSKTSSHSKGNAVDLALARLDAGPGASFDAQGPRVPCTSAFGTRFDEGTLDFGTGYDCFSDLSATQSARVAPEARANRQKLLRAMQSEGFRNYAREWWHFEYTPDQNLPRQDFPIPKQP